VNRDRGLAKLQLEGGEAVEGEMGDLIMSNNSICDSTGAGAARRGPNGLRQSAIDEHRTSKRRIPEGRRTPVSTNCGMA
jgi:hypothetical protein